MSDKNSGQGALIAISDTESRLNNFTGSGLQKFRDTVQDYADQLLDRAKHLGHADKAVNMPPEVTHEHVRSAAHSMARTFGTPSRKKWLIATNVFEYVGAAVAGVGGGHLDNPYGILAFSLGLRADPRRC